MLCTVCVVCVVAFTAHWQATHPSLAGEVNASKGEGWGGSGEGAEVKPECVAFGINASEEDCRVGKSFSAVWQGDVGR